MTEERGPGEPDNGEELRTCPVCGEQVPPYRWLYHPHSPARKRHFLARPFPNWVWAIKAINYLVVLLIAVGITIAALCTGGAAPDG